MIDLNLSERDNKIIWHPFTQMKLADLPIAIVRGEGAYIYDDKGGRYIDAVSSWWVNLHGHSHPHLIRAMIAQLSKLEHVIFAGFTHEPAVVLAEKLLALLPSNQAKVFYSDNGSTAVEVGIKMGIQYWYNQGKSRTRIVALKNSYHGDTFGSMALSARSTFTAPFHEFLFEVQFVDLPDTPEKWQVFEQSLSEEVAAFIFEPLIQGSGGMIMYEPILLNRMLEACKSRGILTIADEVMTGFGRTGKYFAIDHVEEQPDIISLSKGLTGGMMAMGATTCTQEVYDAFLADDHSKTFFHGHSYTANPLACAAGIASMELLLQPATLKSISLIQEMHKEFATQVGKHPKLRDVRIRGTIIAMEWSSEEGRSYFSSKRNDLYHFFLSEGILLRPLGNTLYIMPPYCISERDLNYIYRKIEDALDLI